jgi:hypothetical protein
VGLRSISELKRVLDNTWYVETISAGTPATLSLWLRLRLVLAERPWWASDKTCIAVKGLCCVHGIQRVQHDL